MIYKIINKTKGTVIVSKATVVKGFFQRALGLMFRKSMDSEEALIFYSAESIHMFFMKFPIDVVFLDKNMRIIKICAALKPWRMAACLSSRITIELAADKARETNTDVGDVIEFVS
jgi:uncharacterized membrane protein (UPF0127 family)